MPNRTICDVLREMREAHKRTNYSYLPSLIEEVQVMANRMEAALWDQSDIERYRKEKKELKAEIKLLEEKKMRPEGEK